MQLCRPRTFLYRARRAADVLPIQAGGRWVCWSLLPEKGIEYFLDMARLLRTRHPGVRFLMVGGESASHDRGWLPRMKGYAEQLGLADVVHFAGPREDIPDIMRSIDLLVVPSLNEGFGRVILEAERVGNTRRWSQ